MSSISFAGRVVIVTGAGGGIGRTYALDIARRGGAVVVNDLGCDVAGRNPSPTMADGVVAEIEKAGGRALASYDDVASPKAAQRLVAATLRHFGRIDAVINNAGIMRNAWFAECTEDDLDAVIDTHLRGSLSVTQAAWPHMKAQKYGRVVFASSSTGMYGNKLQTGYAAAKAGITGLMNVLALEGEAHGILCNAIMPNAVGRMAERMLQDMGALQAGEALPVTSGINRSFEPTFNTGMGVFLASEACSTTHSIYSCCLGRIARVFVGVAPGWQGSRERPATAEDIAAHMEQIRDVSRGFQTPTSPRHELELVLAQSPIAP